MFELVYENERTVQVSQPGQSILEISLANGIPHVHACGGHARCSTCRVLILGHTDNLPARSGLELELANRKGLPDQVRLACQSKPQGPLRLRRLVFDEQDQQEVKETSSAGTERSIAVLFSDVRNFTDFSERNLPYDVVHALNRYFTHMGDAILRNGGKIDKYIGDGLMALFGLEEPNPRQACLAALRCAFDMQTSMENVNLYLKRTLDTEFRIGVGLHYGVAVVGELGHSTMRQFTALGDTVNLASRVEAATKRANAGVLVTEDFYQNISGDVTLGRRFRTKLKGKSGEHLLLEPLAITDKTSAKDGQVLSMPAASARKATTLAAEVAEQSVPETPAAPIPATATTHTATVLSLVHVAEGTLALSLQPNRPLRFRPGQFCDLALGTSADEETHTFSFASSPEQPVRLVTRLRPGNYKSRMAALEAGDQVSFSEPNGSFVLPEPLPAAIVLIAGGIGITPFLSFLSDAHLRASRGDTVPLLGRERPVFLFYSNRRTEHAAYLEDLKAMVSELPKLKVVPTLTDFAPADWPGERGRINRAMLKRLLPEDLRPTFYVSGPGAMVDAMHSMLRLWGVPETEIFTEHFAGYSQA